MAVLLTALSFASCSQTDDIATGETNSSANVPVAFSTYTGSNVATRAEVAQAYTKGVIGNEDNADKDMTNLTKARFGVFAYYTEATDYADWSPSSKAPNFMYNQELIYDDAPYWTYSPVKYWPNGIDAANTSGPSNTAVQAAEGKLSFFAFAPYTAHTSTAYSGADKPAAVSAAVTTSATVSGVTAISSNTSNSDVWVKYEMPTAQTNEFVDLLWGLRGKLTYNETDGTNNTIASLGTAYNCDLTKQIVNEKVKFLFKHALAKVGGASSTSETLDTSDPAQCGLKVVVDVDANSATAGAGSDNQTTYLGSNFDNTKTLVTLKSVKIQDGASAAADASVTTVTTATSSLNTFGWFDIETGSWSNAAGTYGYTTGASYDVTATSDDDDETNTTYTLNKDIREPSAAGLAAILSGASWTGTGTADSPRGVTTTAKPVYADENVPALTLIPAGNQTIYITVNYMVRTADTNLAQGYSEVEQTITNQVSLANLNPNKYYTIIMHLGLTSVKFEAVVADWEMDSDGTYGTDGTYTPAAGATDNEEKVWLPSNVIGS